MKRLLFIGFSVFLIGFSFFKAQSLYPLPPSVKVSFFSVGQGDAALIITADKKTLLIDGGPDQSLFEELGKVIPWWHRHLDFILLTHEHDDHLVGLIELSQRYKIGQVFYGEVDENNTLIKEWFENLEKNKIPKKKITVPISFSLGKYCQINILSAAISSDVNDQSLVNELVCGKRKFLFTGDAGKKIENVLLNQGLGSYDVLKVSHHGSLSASQEDFLKVVKPSLAVISVGKNNKFSHPNLEILIRLQKVVDLIWRTDELGTLSVFTNDEELYLKTNR